MHIDCECGGRIRDQTDRVPERANLIADSDFDKALDTFAYWMANSYREYCPADSSKWEAYIKSEQGKEFVKDGFYEVFLQYGMRAYQCGLCGRLYLYVPTDKGAEVYAFQPSGHDRKDLLKGKGRTV